MALIQAENVTLGYDSNPIVENLNFILEKGDYLCIVGENGAGKSTLLKTLLGLQKQLSGDFIFGDGLEKNQIGYLPQQTDVQKDFPASVWEIVLSGCSSKKGFHPFYTKADKQEAIKNIRRMDIEKLKKRCYRELSGGQQQRVLLARALCATKKLIILDEPVAGLDPIVTAQMYNLIKSLNDDGVAVVMISHDIAAALEYSNKILHVSSKPWFGTTDEYVSTHREFSQIGGADDD